MKKRPVLNAVNFIIIKEHTVIPANRILFYALPVDDVSSFQRMGRLYAPHAFITVLVAENDSLRYRRRVQLVLIA